VSRGIGASIARLLGANGYRVCVNYSANGAAADEVVSDIARDDGTALSVQADVGDPDAVAALFDTVDRELGPLTALVNSFARGLSQEVAGEGIRVNTVSPGPTRTDMVDGDQIDAMAAAMPMGRIGEPDEIAEVVLWLLSEQASFVAGATIRAAGGRP